ncbi:hypothetical protein EUX98_g6423 [Antrodiella citrinella]|uniref:Uncharacterized protein n=1 Tax=Antrodiella citrinella TaxID=2447956 RepID=A0A4S4MRM3_9APHY|nr:hypothetical protein EUX98_g6423 [Antrodiella citrinella]
MGWIRSWLEADLSKIGDAKQKFLTRSGVFEGIMDTADEDYKAYFRAWIVDLRTLISKVHRKYEDFQGDCLTPWLEAKKAGKPQKCDKLEKDALELVKARENIMTYETFMECLDEDLAIEA